MHVCVFRLIYVTTVVSCSMRGVWVTGSQKSAWFQLPWFELVPGALSSKTYSTADIHL